MRLRTVLRYILLPLLTVSLLAILALLCSPKPALYPQFAQSAAYLDAEGNLLSLRLASDQRYRLQLKLDDLAPALLQATLRYEDQRFYQHFGVDPAAVLRAFWQSVVQGGRRQGASTLTMQLARMRFNLNSSTVSGKLTQMLYALWLERHYDKATLLEAYFNYAPYGGNIESAGAASLIYFGKAAARLSASEALALALIPQNPNLRSPLTAKGRSALEQARLRLAADWYPSSDEAAALLQLPLSYRDRAALPYLAPHFINQLRSDGLVEGVITTSLDSTLQQQISRQVAAYLKRNQHKGFSNASALLVERSTLKVKAWLGSADFDNAAIAGQVDGVTALRSPGSALKPFVYGLAIEQGLIHPQTLLNDIPRRYGSFNPENFDRQFRGPLTATEALINSRNVPAVQLQARLSKPDFYHWLQQAQVQLPFAAEHYGLALVLGGMDISMQQLVQLYAMLGNGGRWQPLQFTEEDVSAPTQQLLSPEAAFLTLDMLRQHPGVQQGLLSQLAQQRPLAWKTGTSYAFRDTWAIGLSGDYVLAVWLGNFDGSSNANFVGLTAAGPLLFDLLSLLPQDEKANQQLFANTDGLNIKQVALCSRSGDLPNRYCPHTTPGWFIPGVSPVKLSDVHRAVPIVQATGLRACNHSPPDTELKVYEFWPSDIQAAFSRAGVVLTQPPPFTGDCQQKAQQGVPVIRSPQEGVEYQLTATTTTVPLLATLDGGARQAYWFVDNRFVGQSEAAAPLFWQASAGKFRVKVVDDTGSSAEVDIRVTVLQ